MGGGGDKLYQELKKENYQPTVVHRRAADGNPSCIAEKDLLEGTENAGGGEHGRKSE